MPVPLLRRSLWALGIAAILLAIVVVTLPYAASTQIVRDRIADEIGDWSGLNVSIGGYPKIAVWPRFEAVLTEVALSPKGGPSAAPVLKSERMEIKLSAIAALFGNVEFSTVRLIRPTLYVGLTAAGMPDIKVPENGRVGRSIAISGAWSRKTAWHPTPRGCRATSSGTCSSRTAGSSAATAAARLSSLPIWPADWSGKSSTGRPAWLPPAYGAARPST